MGERKHYEISKVQAGGYPRLRVKLHPYYGFAGETFHGDGVLLEMAEWCLENECGYRSSYDIFKFRNNEQMTMFILRGS